MDSRAFDELESAFRTQQAAGLLDELNRQLESEGRYHEWFEGMKLVLRHQLGLPFWSAEAEELPPGALRDAWEEGLLRACERVGEKWLSQGRLREAWNYLRPLGDPAPLQAALRKSEPSAEQVGEWIELCIHEGLDLQRGFSLLLEHFGTCNTITTFDSSMYGQPRARRAWGAACLVNHVYHELRTQLCGSAGLAPHVEWSELLDVARPACAAGSYHLDTTHLASVTRIARDTIAPAEWQMARDLCAYGELLIPALQYAEPRPFEDFYRASARYFEALLNQRRAEHLDYFRLQAEQTDAYHETTRAIEVYVDLLARCGEAARAWSEARRLLANDLPTTGLAPSLWELAVASRQYAAFRDDARQRADRLHFTLALLQEGAT